MIHLCYRSAETKVAGDAPAACASATGAPTVRGHPLQVQGEIKWKKKIIHWSRCLKAGELFLESLVLFIFFFKILLPLKFRRKKKEEIISLFY